jgi:hypothetical protein
MISLPSCNSIPFGSGVTLVILEKETASEESTELVWALVQTPAIEAHRKSGKKEIMALRVHIYFSKELNMRTDIQRTLHALCATKEAKAAAAPAPPRPEQGLEVKLQ